MPDLHVTISMITLESLSTIRWVTPCFCANYMLVYIPYISKCRASQIFRVYPCIQQPHEFYNKSSHPPRYASSLQATLQLNLIQPSWRHFQPMYIVYICLRPLLKWSCLYLSISLAILSITWVGSSYIRKDSLKIYLFRHFYRYQQFTMKMVFHLCRYYVTISHLFLSEFELYTLQL